MIQHQEKKQNNPHTLAIALLSAMSIWLGDMVFYPFDTISTRLKGSKHDNYSVIPFIKHSIKTDGKKLYRGFFLTFPHSFVPTTIYLYIYETLMHTMSDWVYEKTKRKQMKLLFPFFVSSISEYICLFAILPIETVRTRIQMNRPEYEYSSLYEGISEIKKKQGFMRLYKASKVYFTCKVLYSSIQMQCFETIRFYTAPSGLNTILNTIVSTFIATTLLNPLEVLLTRYALVDTTKKKLVFSHMVKRLHKREGIAGFYKGYPIELLLHIMYSLFWMPCFDFCRTYYGIEIAE